jgi:cytochrome c556
MERGLSNNPRIRKKVINRMMNTRSYMSALAEKESVIRARPYSYQSNTLDKAKYNQFEKSAKTGVPQSNSKLNKDFARYGARFNRLQGAIEKDLDARKAKKVKTMANIMKGIKNISVVGLVSNIMQPKKVGDATLDKGKYRIVK